MAVYDACLEEKYLCDWLVSCANKLVAFSWNTIFTWKNDNYSYLNGYLYIFSQKQMKWASHFRENNWQFIAKINSVFQAKIRILENISATMSLAAS